MGKLLRSLLNGRLAVHVCYLFLKDSADVDTSTFQRGGEKAVGDAERLWMQVKVFHLNGEKEKVRSDDKSPDWEVCSSQTLTKTLLTCSKDFSPARFPSALMSSNTAFFTSCWKTNNSVSVFKKHAAM